MKLLIIGDMHGSLLQLSRILLEAKKLYGIDGAIQVGDFGFYPRIIDRFEQELVRFRLPVYAIDGNHEHHEWLWSLTVAEHDKLHERNLFYMRRGIVQNLDGSIIGYLGGALNADRPQELNVITNDEADMAAKLFNQAKPDLIVTHSCPADSRVGVRGSPALVEDVEKFIRRAGYDPGPFGDCGEPALRRLWNQLEHRPPNWVFGHFHHHHVQAVGNTLFTCVGCGDGTDGERGQLPYIFDTQTKTLTLAGDARLSGDKPSRRIHGKI